MDKLVHMRTAWLLLDMASLAGMVWAAGYDDGDWVNHSERECE